MGTVRKTQKQFTGLEADLPTTKDIGSSYACEDTGKLFYYNADRLPIEFTSGGSAPVSSIFGRTGVISAQESDYSSYYDLKSQGRIICNQANKDTTLGGVIDSTKEYFIDGIINMGNTQIKVPPLGIQIKGYSFALSGLITDENNHVLFVNQLPTCGNVVMSDLYISVNGSSSEVYGLINDGSGFFVNSGMAYYDCTSLGQLIQFQQGLEENVTKVGGRPFLVLSGEWDGWKANSVLIRNLDIQMNESLYREGSILTFDSRFLIDANVDLPMLASFIDFAPTVFKQSSAFQVNNCIFTRGGVTTNEDSNIVPNTLHSNVKANFKNNVGLNNTFVGCEMEVTTATETVFTTSNQVVDLNGTWSLSIDQHFVKANPNGVEHLGAIPNEFLVNYDMVIEGKSGDEIDLIFIKDDGTNATIVSSQVRPINSLAGARDVGFFNRAFDVKLNQGDKLYVQVSNRTSSSNVTAEVSSYFLVTQR